VSADAPLLLRALRGDPVERPPVWMMRQAGRYMKVGGERRGWEREERRRRAQPTHPSPSLSPFPQVYQDLCKKHTTFRERSENADIAVEVSLQPWRAFKPDGVILFSDILTPLTGMGIEFDITAGKGPVIADPIRTLEQVKKVTPLVAGDATPYVGAALRALRAEVGNAAAVLGFVGAPFTLATYIVEGRDSIFFLLFFRRSRPT
jgi:uroporphyrinogen decarboxylase